VYHVIAVDIELLLDELVDVFAGCRHADEAIFKYMVIWGNVTAGIS
jgi:hypothetical protein